MTLCLLPSPRNPKYVMTLMNLNTLGFIAVTIKHKNNHPRKSYDNFSFLCGYYKTLNAGRRLDCHSRRHIHMYVLCAYAWLLQHINRCREYNKVDNVLFKRGAFFLFDKMRTMLFIKCDERLHNLILYMKIKRKRQPGKTSK